MKTSGSVRSSPERTSLRALRYGGMVAAALIAAGCAVGPDYQKPVVQIPATFKEGVDWQRAEANPQASLSSTWWLDYHDDKLTDLIDQSLKANQSIAQAEAAYRLATATVEANTASLFPTITAGASGARSGYGNGAAAAATSSTSTAVPGVNNSVGVNAAASWEIDLWGQIRREIESSKASAQASDAQLAGERLSIAASVAVDYFELRQADVDIDLLKQQQQLFGRILDMTRESYKQGNSSADDVLNAQDNLELVIAELQTTQITREQDEHAIAVLIGVPPGGFSIEADPHYAFATPAVPLALPSQLLERRYDVVSAERTAASANAKIGVAEAAFFPTLTLSAEGGFQHNMLANLFSVPNRFWTLGPDLAATIFDGGARTAAVHEARATYDENVASYRQTVLSAFQSVEDSLSSWNHLQQQADAYANIYQRNRQLFDSEHAQYTIGTASEQDLLNQQLTLLTAQQNLSDTHALLTESSVTLIKNLGGGWQWDDNKEHAVDALASAGQPPAAASAASASPVR
ncbi:efflux transporter outer membrane subunit [Paraburkholderia sp. J12]|uniref:efflux transporter outer membrane subunit n=1 Tax=Paraburkholderia sp. J12 TaxID=2805432 RepID=UPI002ABE3B75|nr:efflux transporter outer membrane subunit [Paraburkholderia sp. J12]